MSIKSWLFGFLEKTPKNEKESEEEWTAEDAIERVKERVRTEKELAKIEEEGMNAFKDLHSMMDKMNETEEEEEGWGEIVDEDGKTKK